MLQSIKMKFGSKKYFMSEKGSSIGTIDQQHKKGE